MVTAEAQGSHFESCRYIEGLQLTNAPASIFPAADVGSARVVGIRHDEVVVLLPVVLLHAARRKPACLSTGRTPTAAG